DGDLTNAGSIVLTSTGNGYSYLNLNGHALTNSGSISVEPGSGTGARYLRNGPLLNTGTVSVGVALESNSLSFTNQGAVSVTAGDWALNTSFTNTSGSVSSSGSGEVVSSGTYVQGNGSASGNPIRIVGGAVQFTGSGSSTVWVDNTSIGVTGNIA